MVKVAKMNGDDRSDFSVMLAAITMRIAAHMVDQCEAFEEQVSCASMHGGPPLDEEPAEMRTGRRWLSRCASDLAKALHPVVADGGADAVLQQFLAGRVDQRGHPSLTTVPTALRAALMSDALYDDVPEAAQAVAQLTQHLRAAGLLPASLARRAQSLPRWAGAAVPVCDDRQECFEVVSAWAEDPASKVEESD